MDHTKLAVFKTLKKNLFFFSFWENTGISGNVASLQIGNVLW